MRRSALVAALVAVLANVLTAVTLATAAPSTAIAAGPAHHRSRAPVSTAVYNLGDQVFTDPRVTSYQKPHAPVPMELSAVVHYPTDLGTTEHPLVIVEHGQWWSCVNFASGEPNGSWPCTHGSSPMPSDRGYDYLGRTLAGRGFIVVSIGNNAINAHVLGDPEAIGRAALINQHLRMWQQLATTGTGPLAGAFVDPRTGASVAPAFQGHVDTEDVGTIGHSRGGKGVLWQAADRHRREWPDGVRVRAVMALAPAHDGGAVVDPADTRVSDIPLEIVSSSCDGAVGPNVGRDYLRELHGRNHDASAVTIRGGNHNFFNVRWSPGHVTGYDDATSPCAGALTAAEQRQQTRRLVADFFTRELSGPQHVG